MSALETQNLIEKIQVEMGSIAPHRHAQLFSSFLYKGYQAVTLDSVPKESFNRLLQAKICLGTLITLYDDFADLPQYSQNKILEILHQLNFEHTSAPLSLNANDRQIIFFAVTLLQEIKRLIEPLPHYTRLKNLLNFDLTQFYNANHYSSLITNDSALNNQLEKSLYSHHNMGIVLIGMMDIMSVEKLDFSELGKTREVFLMAQRMGRIYNVLNTYQREKNEKDLTSDLSTFNDQELKKAQRKLEIELRILSKKIESHHSHIKSFSVKKYLSGLKQVHQLHEEMRGII